MSSLWQRAKGNITGSGGVRKRVTTENSHASKADFPVHLTDDEWREKLSAAEYQVLRKAGTERAFVGEYTDTETEGVYSCKACGAELFRSEHKFHSGCGWPSFYKPSEIDTVVERTDSSLGMKRTEVLCANCGSHLGHVFDDGYGTPTGQRYCINSISMTLEPTGSGPA